MKLLKYLLLVVAVSTFVSPAVYAECDESGDVTHYEKELDERDWSALYDYINTKRTINVQEKACNLTISGDVRSEWRHMRENLAGRVVRVNGGELPSRNDIDIEFNLRFDYVHDRAWAVAHLDFDNSAGNWNDRKCIETIDGIDVSYREDIHGSGVGCDISLKKAYMGYNVCCDGCTRFDIELGRRNLFNVFDSEVQFLSRFDGILFKYSSCSECLGDWYVNAAGFVVDYRSNHYAWIVEAGLLNLLDTGFDVKYSFIEWKKHGENVCGVKNPKGAQFEVSQFTVAYHLDPEFLCMPAKAFGAVLFNSAASPLGITSATDFIHSQNDNLGWYAGLQIGEVVYEGDWAVKAQYQYVQALAVPDFDVSGIGSGNALGYSIPGNGVGNTNYKGWRIEGLYALTDNITIDTRIQWSRQIKSSYVGTHHYSEYRIQAIYAF